MRSGSLALKTMLLTAIVGSATVCASAAERPAERREPPGVVLPPPMVKPLPEPLAAAEDRGFIRSGRWDIRISGEVSVDIRAGDLGRKDR